jgi:hypothetical protein
LGGIPYIGIKGTIWRDWDGIKMKVLSPDKIREGLAILNKTTRQPQALFFQ